MAHEYKEAKRYTIPSSDWGVTADEAASILLKAEEIKAMPDLLKAARKNLKAKKKALEAAVT